jgi:hypothetical protein
MTVSDRQEPPEPAPHGTEMARGEVGREDRLPPGAIADLACTTKFVLRDHCFMPKPPERARGRARPGAVA